MDDLIKRAMPRDVSRDGSYLVRRMALSWWKPKWWL